MPIRIVQSSLRRRDSPAIRCRDTMITWESCGGAASTSRCHWTRLWHVPQHKHRFSFTKVKAWALGYYEKVIWFDADLHVVGNLDELFDFKLRDVRGLGVMLVVVGVVNFRGEKGPPLLNVIWAWA